MKVTQYSGLMMLGELEEGKKIIDCGCGTGEWLQFLKRYLKPTLLVGIDQNYLKVGHATHYHSTLVLGQIQRLPFENSAFDYFFCVETLEHIDSYLNQSITKEIFRVLVPGGRLLISVPGNKTYCLSGSDHRQFWSRKKLNRAFFGFGFTGLFTHRKNAVYVKYREVPTKCPYNYSNLMMFEKRVN